MAQPYFAVVVRQNEMAKTPDDVEADESEEQQQEQATPQAAAPAFVSETAGNNGAEMVMDEEEVFKLVVGFVLMKIVITVTPFPTAAPFTKSQIPQLDYKFKMDGWRSSINLNF